MSINVFLNERAKFEGELPVDPDSLRHRVALLNPELKTQLENIRRSGPASAALTANLFEDAQHNLLLEEATKEDGYEVLRGKLENIEDSRVVLTFDGETVTLTVLTGDHEYQVVPLTVDIYLIEEVSLEAPDCSTPDSSGEHEHEEGEIDTTEPGDNRGSSAVATINILLLYTSSVKATLGGEVGLNAFVRTIFANFNTALLDSKTNAVVRLAGLKQADLPGIPDGNCDATDFLQNSETVKGWRSETKADLVSIIRNTSGTSCADCLMTLRGRKSAAFSSIKLSQARQRHSFAHEIGHNLGCAHDRDNSSGGCAEDTGRGYRFRAGNLSRGTLMAYGSNRVLLFSNPDVKFMGVPVGTVRDNNAATIRKTAPKVALYGESL